MVLGPFSEQVLSVTHLFNLIEDDGSSNLPLPPNFPKKKRRANASENDMVSGTQLVGDIEHVGMGTGLSNLS